MRALEAPPPAGGDESSGSLSEESSGRRNEALVAERLDENPFAHGRAQLTAGLMLTIVAVAFQSLAIATVLPAVVADLGGLNLYGWAFSAFLLTQLVGIVAARALRDRGGPVAAVAPWL